MGPPYRVVIVDDQDIFVRSVHALLDTSDGIEVVGSAWNGEHALELVAELSPDIVLMDIDMPVMDGVEATKQIAVRFPDVRVLVVSGLHEPERVEAALQGGAFASLAKDRISEELVDKILSMGEADAAAS